MNKRKSSSALPIFIIVVLSVAIMITGLIVARGLIKGDGGRYRVYESSLNDLTRGYYEELAYNNYRTMYNPPRMSNDMKAGLAVGEYYNYAIIAKAHEALGDNEGARLWLDGMEKSRMKMGSFSAFSQNIDEIISDALNKAGNIQ